MVTVSIILRNLFQTYVSGECAHISKGTRSPQERYFLLSVVMKESQKTLFSMQGFLNLAARKTPGEATEIQISRPQIVRVMDRSGWLILLPPQFIMIGQSLPCGLADATPETWEQDRRNNFGAQARGKCGAPHSKRWGTHARKGTTLQSFFSFFSGLSHRWVTSPRHLQSNGG